MKKTIENVKSVKSVKFVQFYKMTDRIPSAGSSGRLIWTMVRYLEDGNDPYQYMHSHDKQPTSKFTYSFIDHLNHLISTGACHPTVALKNEALLYLWSWTKTRSYVFFEIQILKW